MFRKKMIGLIILVIMALPVWAMAAENPQTPAGPEILSLRQCLETALKNNKQIQAKEKEVTIAESTVKEAEAGFQPTVNYQAERDQSDVAQYQVGPAYEKTDFTAGVFLSVPLYTGGMLRNNLKLARLQLEAAGEGLRKAKQQLTYDVKQAYYNVWLAEQIVRVQESSYRNMDEHVSRMESRYRAEVASKLDVLRATVQRDTLKPKVINAKNQLALAKLQLATIIDFSKDKPFEVQYDIYELKMPEAIEISLTKILDEAYLDRPEIRQIAQLAEINQVVTAMKQAGYRPNLILAAGYGGERKDILSDEEWYGAWMLTLTVGGKIFDRAIQERVEQAKGKEELTAIQKLDFY